MLRRKKLVNWTWPLILLSLTCSRHIEAAQPPAARPSVTPAAVLGGPRFLPRSNTVSELKFSPDGSHIAALSATYFGATRPGLEVFSRSSGESVGPRQLRNRKVTALAWSPDSSRFAICVEEPSHQVEIWDLQKLRQSFPVGPDAPQFRCVDWAPNGKLLAAAQHDGTTYVWDVESEMVVRHREKPATCLEFTHDSQQLIVAGEQECELYDFRADKVLDSVPISVQSPNDIELQPGADRVALAARDAVYLWDYRAQRLEKLNRIKGSVWSLAFSPHGEHLAMCAITEESSGVVLAKTGEWVSRLKATGFAIDYAPDGKTVALAHRRIEFRDPMTGDPAHEVHAHHRGIHRLFPFPDGSRLRSVQYGGDSRIWDLRRGESVALREFKSIHEVITRQRIAYANSGEHWAVLDHSTGVIEVDSTDPALNIVKIRMADDARPIAPVISFAVAPDRSAVVTLSDDGWLRFWSCRTRRLLDSVKTPVQKLPSKPDEVLTVEGIPDQIRYDASGRLLLRVSWSQQQVELIDAATRTRKKLLELGVAVLLVYPVTVTPDHQWLISIADQGIQKLSVEDGSTQLLIRAGNLIIGLGLSHDGRLLAVSEYTQSNETRIRLVDMQRAIEIGRVDHVDGMVRAFSFSRDGKQLMAGASDSNIYVWNLRDIIQGD